jgi:hypothetical protein
MTTFVDGQTVVTAAWLNSVDAFVNGGGGTGNVTTTGVQTLTNKRVTLRVLSSSANTANVAINTDNCDVFKVLGQTVAITGFTMTGTPQDNDPLIIEITGTTSVPITWGTSFEAGDSSLPTTTTGTNMLAVSFLWNTATSKWRCMGGGAIANTSISNTRISARVLPLSANSATPAINTDAYDQVNITAQTAAITSFTSGLTGTPVEGDKLIIRITGTTSVALTWGTSFESTTQTLPTTTSGTARLSVGFHWNSANSKWDCVAVA